MCTAVVSVAAGSVLVAGIRDEFVSRAWQPPGRHWPEYPGLVGGRDLLAGGTWLAVAPAAPRVACVLNARGRMAPPQSRRSRGVLPLQAAAGERLDRSLLADVDPFHLLTAEPGWAALASWDGEHLTDRELPTGLHFIVNSGIGGQLRNAHDIETARVAHFLPRFRDATRPAAAPGAPAAEAWGTWLPLVNGDGIGPGDARALIVRRDLGGGRVWGTTSISLVALSPEGVRYDFTGEPGNPVSWYPVTL
jgi:Transport and Golgi organisation 2